MGVKDFSKVFTATAVVKPKDMAGTSIAIDAMSEIYRAALGAKSVSVLTDKYGKPTLHISVILANIIEFVRNKVDMIWVFDYDSEGKENEVFHNPAKLAELEKRKKKKEDAKKKHEELFTDSEDDDEDKKVKEDKKASLQKQMFSATKEMINDVKLILNCLNIKYVEAPHGFEGECVCTYLNTTGKVDAVYSSDADPIPFGCVKLYRRNPRDKKVYEYNRADLLEQIKQANEEFTDPDLDDLRKVCIILGTDFAPKTPKIGAKTVLPKLHTIKLTKVQKDKALKAFEKEPTSDTIVICNEDKQPFVDSEYAFLIDWLVNERSFTRTRINNWFEKILNEDGTIKENKPRASKKPAAKKSAVMDDDAEDEVAVEKIVPKRVPRKKSSKKVVAGDQADDHVDKEE